MRTIVIDDEPWMLKHFSNECAGIDEIQLVGSYRNPLKALEYAEDNAVDLAFIDMEMPQLSGTDTAKRLGEMQGGVKIVIISAHDESYIRTHPELAACQYLHKPYRRNDLLAVIGRL